VALRAAFALDPQGMAMAVGRGWSVVILPCVSGWSRSAQRLPPVGRGSDGQVMTHTNSGWGTKRMGVMIAIGRVAGAGAPWAFSGECARHQWNPAGI